ncbi:hypothetical protein SAMN04487861_10954 [Selenomonas ruminantium]|uniref:Immunity protein Imm1 n=1 Tax=Selenomonas ruminantium TaxID=971 RepID=A0A1I3E869_SELRU|nr:hypothetical protein [Selenomonas ruminantium]SFH95154.1 hypothetical protein SAMN04487861_10954 [Selenomonas ruminantium]
MGKVEMISYDLANGINYDQIELEKPSWEQILEIISKLDGKETTEVSLYALEESICLCIGGGNNNLYNVYYSEEYGEKNYTLKKRGGVLFEKHKLITGGQMGEFEDNICVGKDMVRIVVEYFYIYGCMYKGYVWNIE